MPARALRPCSKPNCGALGSGKYCAAHVDEDQRRRMADDKARGAHPLRKLYGTPRWEATRLQVITRDPVCKLCGMRASQVAHHRERARIYAALDHELFFDISNLEGVCKRCHDA